MFTLTWWNRTSPNQKLMNVKEQLNRFRSLLQSHPFLFSFYLCQVVKVVGSNISHKLRLSRVKPSDEGTYECRVIDFSDDAGARHHRARAYLQVVSDGDVVDNHNNFEAVDDTKRAVGVLDREAQGGTKEHSHHQGRGRHQEHDKRPPSSSHHNHGGGGSQLQHKASRELRKREVDSNHSHNDCTNEPSCTL